MKKSLTGQKLYKKAKKLIPGGTMLLSKRPEMFLPNNWPSYFSKAKGIDIWDLDKNKFTDMCIMGIGTNILGYGNEEVDNAVLKSLKNGNLSTLNCPEEVKLAEKLVEINHGLTWLDSQNRRRSNQLLLELGELVQGKIKLLFVVIMMA